MINIIRQSKALVSGRYIEELADKISVEDHERLHAAVNDLIAAVILGVCQKTWDDSGARELARDLEEKFQPIDPDDTVDVLHEMDRNESENIARDLFRKQRNEVVNSVSRMSGLELKTIEEALSHVIPVVMRFMAGVKQERGLDKDGLKRTITYSLESHEGETAEIFLLEKILERNKHTSWTKELSQYGEKFLGSML